MKGVFLRWRACSRELLLSALLAVERGCKQAIAGFVNRLFGSEVILKLAKGQLDGYIVSYRFDLGQTK